MANRKTMASVYSAAEIHRHEKRIRDMEERSISDSESCVDSICESTDGIVDINYRIFEEGKKSGVVEMSCSIKRKTLEQDEEETTLNGSIADTIEGSNGINTLKNEIIARIRDELTDEYIKENEVPDELTNENCTHDAKIQDEQMSGDEKRTKVQDELTCDQGENSVEDHREEMENSRAESILCPSDYEDLDVSVFTFKPIIRKRRTQTKKPQNKITLAPIIERSKVRLVDLIHFNPSSEHDTSSRSRQSVKLEPIEEQRELTPGPSSVDEEPQEAPVPRVKLDESGNIIIDSESLVIDQSGVAKVKESLESNEVITETKTSTFRRKPTFAKQWSPHETLKFYILLNTFGTDFTVMASHFPGRTRNCLKRKFRREEKCRPDLVDSALRMDGSFDIPGVQKVFRVIDEKVYAGKKLQSEKKRELEPKEENKEMKKVKRFRKKKSVAHKMLFGDQGSSGGTSEIPLSVEHPQEGQTAQGTCDINNSQGKSQSVALSVEHSQAAQIAQGTCNINSLQDKSQSVTLSVEHPQAGQAAQGTGDTNSSQDKSQSVALSVKHPRAGQAAQGTCDTNSSQDKSQSVALSVEHPQAEQTSQGTCDVNSLQDKSQSVALSVEHPQAGQAAQGTCDTNSLQGKSQSVATAGPRLKQLLCGS